MNTSTHILKNTNTEPHCDKTNEMASAPSEDSEQHGRMLRLICVFAWRTSVSLSEYCSVNGHVFILIPKILLNYDTNCEKFIS